MDKKKDFNPMQMERDISKLMGEIKKQDFKSTDELNAFVNNLTGRSLDDLPESTDNKGRAQDLVYEAYDLPVEKAKKLIKQALELDPDNADAYNYLASIEDDIDKAIKLYEKAIKAAEKTLGKKFFEEEKGYFWGLVETRPYMRAKAGLADCFYVKDEDDKAIEIYEEMLELNPNDNQGIRYMLSTLLLEKGDLNKFELFVKGWEQEDNAVWKFNNALYYFKKYGRSAKSNKLLLKAHKSNMFVIDYLLGIKKLPEERPQYVGTGDESEAISYVFDALPAWTQSEDTFMWLLEFKQKSMRINKR